MKKVSMFLVVLTLVLFGLALTGSVFSWDRGQADKPLLDAKTGKKLPEGGGEPGKAYGVYCKALVGKDGATIRKMAPEIMGKVPEAEFKRSLDIISEMTPKDVKIVDGYGSGDRATLYVTGTLEKEKNYGTVDMVKKAGQWTIRYESWENTPPKK